MGRFADEKETSLRGWLRMESFSQREEIEDDTRRAPGPLMASSLARGLGRLEVGWEGRQEFEESRRGEEEEERKREEEGKKEEVEEERKREEGEEEEATEEEVDEELREEEVEEEEGVGIVTEDKGGKLSFKGL